MRSTQEKKQPLLLITYPRSASNLLVRILNLPEQQQALSRESGGYHFFPAAVSMNQNGLLHRSRAEWSERETGNLQKKYQACFEQLQQLLDEADVQGKMAVTKEHAPFLMSPTAVSDFLHDSDNAGSPWKVDVSQKYSGSPMALSDARPNPSVLPDEFLLRCTPAFLIRHPALAFPSYYRLILAFSDGDMAKAEDKMVPYIAIGCTLHWTRQLYDWYTSAWAAQGLDSKGPIVLDADDMIHDPAVILRFCRLVGLDPEKVRFHWDPQTKDGQEAVSAMSTVSAKTRATLYSSSGITQGKTFDGLTIEGEAEKWKAEFGELVGNRIEGWVRAAMPDYTYLVGKRLEAKLE